MKTRNEAAVPMKGVRKAALEMLRSPQFFDKLRAALRVGLPGEEVLGMGVFLVAASRFRPNPLRLLIREGTEGTASYIVRKVSQFLPPGSVVNLTPEDGEGWRRFAKDPQQKVVWVPEWNHWGNGGSSHLEIGKNQLTRVTPVKRDERTIENREEIKGGFACISAEAPPEQNEQSRWLTLRLPRKAGADPDQERHILPRGGAEVEAWREVQRQLQERAHVPIVLPDWGDVVVEQMCGDERVSRHIPALLQVWKTMCLLRSFQYGYDERAGMLQARFEDLAAAVLMARKAFWEGQRFPSPRGVFDKISPAIQNAALMNPVTGNGIRYTHQEKARMHWKTILPED